MARCGATQRDLPLHRRRRTGPNSGRLTGDLTIRGVTHPATFDVTYNGSHAQHPMGFPIALIGFTAKTTISRSAYGLNVLPEMAPGAGDGVADAVQLTIDAEFTRPVEAQPALGKMSASPRRGATAPSRSFCIGRSRRRFFRSRSASG